jgi:uncharacterized protein (DUF1015 family)
VQHTVWVVSDPQIVSFIQQEMTDKKLLIADGHHRYEAALRYLRNQESQGRVNPNAAYNFVMMTLVEFDDPGLLLLPYHRTVGGLSLTQLAQVQEQLDELFEARPVDLASPGGVERLLDQVAFLGKDRHACALIGPARGDAYLLMLREGVDWQQWGPLAVSEAWVLEEKVLRSLLGETITQHVNYTHDYELAVEQVASGAQQLAFLLKPFPMEAFETIVGGGQRLPSKSTFFYPKLPTGLVINQLEGSL